MGRYKPPRVGGARRPSGGASPEEGSTSDLEAEAASELTSLLLEPGCSCDCGTACAANNRLHAVRDRSGGARVAEAAIEALFEVRGQTGTCKCGSFANRRRKACACEDSGGPGSSYGRECMRLGRRLPGGVSRRNDQSSCCLLLRAVARLSCPFSNELQAF